MRRKYIHDRLNAHVVALRKNDFEVEVYEDVIVKLAQKEANMVGRLAESAKDPDSITRQRVKDLEKMMPAE